MREKSRSNPRSGAALLTVMGICFAIFTVLGTVVFTSMQQSHLAERLANRTRAIAIAEAGVASAYSILVTNFDARANSQNFPGAAYAGGSYALSVLPVGSNVAVISCTGTYDNASEWVVLDATRNTLGGSSTNGGAITPPRSSPWAYSVLVNGYILHNGSGNAYGTIHANNYIQCNGSIEWGWTTNETYVSVSGSSGFDDNGNATIYGTVEAPRIDVSGHANITHEIIGPVPTVSMPDMSAFLTECYAIAVSNNQVYSGGTIKNSVNWGTVPGGIRWINGSITQKKGTITMEGALIATGNITLKGGFNHARVGNLPALVSRDGKITCNGSHTVNGLVYAKSDITWNGSGTVHGGIICGGNLRFNGSYGNIYYGYCEPSVPGSSQPPGGSATQAVVMVNCWQR